MRKVVSFFNKGKTTSHFNLGQLSQFPRANITTKRYMSNVNKKGYTPNVHNEAKNMPKAIRVPIMKILYGVIAFMAIVPICQSLYETNKYYRENAHLYGNRKP